MDADVRPRFLLPVLASAQLLIVLDTTIVNVALPVIAADLRLSQDQLSWVASVYLLVFGSLLPLGGRLADLAGSRTTFLAGTMIFAGGSLIGGTASGFAALVAGRATQGVGAALLSPAGLSILARTYNRGPARNRALATWSAVCSAGAPLGAVFGGALTASLGWSSVLLINVPVCLACAGLIALAIPPIQSHSPGGATDWVGAFTMAAGLSALMYGLTTFARSTSLLPIAASTGGLALIACFVHVEKRISTPLFPSRIATEPSLVVASVVTLIGSLCLLGIQLYVTLYLERVVALPPLRTGLALLPFGLCAVLAPLLALPLVAAVGSRPVMALGLGGLALSASLWSTIDGSDDYGSRVLPGLVLAAIGYEILLVAAYVDGLSGIRDVDAGLAAAVLGAAQLLGGAVGFAVDAVLYATASGQPTVTASAESLRGIRVVFAANAALSMLASGLLLARARRERQSPAIERSG